MKKILLASAMLFSAYGFSQLREKGTIEVTPLIGYASSTFTGDNVENAKTLSSINFGVNADYYFNNRWGIRSGVLLQNMGAAGDGGKLELQYVTIPVNANWHFGSTRKWNLNFGPSIGFLTKAETVLNGGATFDAKDAIESTQIGFNVGIGYKIEVSEKFSILVEYQGMGGLSNISTDSNEKIRNSHGTFNVGAVLKL